MKALSRLPHVLVVVLGASAPVTARATSVERLGPASDGPPPAAEDAADPQELPGGPDQRAKDLIRRGQQRFEQEDYLGAIDLWQQAHDLLPVCEVSLRDELYLYLGSAHRSAYARTKQEQHLRAALQMYTKHRDVLGSHYEQLRAQTEAEIAKLEAELKVIDDARIQAEREQAARAAVAREQERQQQREREHERELQRLQAELTRQLAIDTTIFGTGLVATLGGAVLLGSGAWLLGSANDRRDEQLERLATGDYEDEPGARAQLRRWHARGRGVAVTSLLGGTVLVGAGVGLSAWGAVRRIDQQPARVRARRVSGAFIVGSGLLAIAGGASLFGSGVRMLDTVETRATAQAEALDADVYPDEADLREQLARWSDQRHRRALGVTTGGAILVGGGIGLTLWGLARVRRAARSRSPERAYRVVPMASKRALGLGVTATF